MSKTGTEHSTWTSLTSDVNTSVSNIFDMIPLHFSYTDLALFKDFSENYITLLNDSLATLRSYSVSDVHHMNQASENKVSDDSAGAGKFSSGGGM